MPSISTSQQVCTVVVTVDASSEIIDDLAEHARLGLERFPECGGFIAGALHISDNRTRLIQYLQWASEAAYVTCRDDPRWDHLPSTQRFMEHITTGPAQIDARTYTVIASTHQHNPTQS